LKQLALLLAFAGFVLPAGAQTKVATIHVQNAILSTKDGQKAQQELQAKFMPRRQGLEKKQQELQSLQTQMRTGSATLSQAARDKLTRDIDAGTKALQRESEDFGAEVQQEEGRLMNELGQKMMSIISKFAAQRSISVVLDVSNPQSPVLWADAAIDITNDVVKQYDESNAAAAAPPATPPPAPKKQ
jgi:outer membrane protein